MLRKLEALPGFEPGVEVLQTGSAIVMLLTRLAFWSALTARFARCLGVSVPKLFPSFGLSGVCHSVRTEGAGSAAPDMSAAGVRFVTT